MCLSNRVEILYTCRNSNREQLWVGSIPAGGPIVDEFFSTVPGSNFDMCIIFPLDY